MGDNCDNTIKAGRITGNPLHGLCDKVCIQVLRVFDGCVSRTPSISFMLTLTDFVPDDLIYPFTYVSTMSFGETIVENQVITPLDGRRARITYDVITPVTVNFTDASGRAGRASSFITQHKEVILKIPSRSLTPFKIEVTSTIASDIGTFLSPTTVTEICCSVIVTKIVIPTDIVVPSYGNTVFPECCEGNRDICNSFFNLPLFPPLDE